MIRSNPPKNSNKNNYSTETFGQVTRGFSAMENSSQDPKYKMLFIHSFSSML